MACTLDAQGRKLHAARIDGNGPAAFAAYFNGAQGGAKGAAPLRDYFAAHAPMAPTWIITRIRG